MPNLEAVLSEALQLSPDDRARLIEELEASLDPQGFATPEIAAAWSAEIDRRMAAYDRGEIKAVTVEESMKRLRQSLAEHRSRRLIEGIREGLADVEAGHTKPAREALLALADKYKMTIKPE